MPKMSRIISQLIDVPEAMVASTIEKLEQKTGYHSHDVRRLAENSQNVRSKMNDLGFDPEDTTGEEIYNGLLAKYQNDCKVIDKALSINSQSTLNERVAKAITLVGKFSTGANTWALKKSTLKKVLGGVPAKRTMRLMHYRSYESMIKREDSQKLFMMANLLESPTWRKNANKAVSKLTSSAYEPREVKIVEIESGSDKKLVIADVRSGLIGVNTGMFSKNTPVLAIALQIHDGVAKISKEFDKKQIMSINPILSWWEDTEHLLAWNDGAPVSLNFRDVAHAHLNCLSYEDRSKLYGAKNFWAKMLESYEDTVEEVPSEIANFGQVIETKAANTFVSPINEMAYELEED